MSPGAAPKSAVLLLGFGGPDCLDAVEPFMCNLMETAPPEALVESVKARYAAIGGGSPLMNIASSIANGVEAALAGDGAPVPVAPAMRYWHPFIDDTLRELYDRGVRRVVTLSLSPFESAVSTGAYREAMAEASANLPGLAVVEAPMLRELPAFLGLLTDGARQALARLRGCEPALTVFTAHSLPVEDLEDDDRYVAQLRAAVDAVVSGLGMAPGAVIDGANARLTGVSGYGSLDGETSWILAYQSRGRRGGEWLGPDISEVVQRAIDSGYRGLAICPVGFATDHMETLYDLDIVLAKAIDSAGAGSVAYARATVPNDDPLIVNAIAEAVRPLL